MLHLKGVIFSSFSSLALVLACSKFDLCLFSLPFTFATSLVSGFRAYKEDQDDARYQTHCANCIKAFQRISTSMRQVETGLKLQQHENWAKWIDQIQQYEQIKLKKVIADATDGLIGLVLPE